MDKLNKIIPLDMIIPLALSFTFNCIAYYGTRLLVSDNYHYDLTNSFDNMIPLVPWTIIIYWGCYLYWGINYILGCRQDKSEAFRFISADLLAKFVCLLVFVFLPTTNVRPVIEGSGIFDNWMIKLYQVDAADNLFPSIHCLTSWFCYIAVRKNERVPKWYKIFSLVFALMICVSTLTTKQHVLVDVVGGVLLAEGSYHIVYKTGFCELYRRCISRVEQRISKQS